MMTSSRMASSQRWTPRAQRKTSWSSKALTKQAPWVNYVSVEEELQAGGDELDRLVKKDYA
eukprot:15531871-Heterocapsa_arctica.AAC.1